MFPGLTLALKATLGLFERILKELWISGIVGGAIGGVVVLIGLVVLQAAGLHLFSPPAEPPLVPHPRRKRPRAKRPA